MHLQSLITAEVGLVTILPVLRLISSFNTGSENPGWCEPTFQPGPYLSPSRPYEIVRTADLLDEPSLAEIVALVLAVTFVV